MNDRKDSAPVSPCTYPPDNYLLKHMREFIRGYPRTREQKTAEIMWWYTNLNRRERGRMFYHMRRALMDEGLW